MSEGLRFEDLTLPSHSAQARAGEPPPISAGQMLKQARVNAGLHVAALAVTLKVPVKRLEALEDDNIALLPDVVFMRALAASVCRTLNVDPAPIMEKLPKASSPRLKSQYASINMPIRTSTSTGKLNFFEFLKTPWVIGVLLLLIGAAAIYVWPKVRLPSSLEIPTTAALTVKSVDLQALQELNITKNLVPNVDAVNEGPAAAMPVLSREAILSAESQSSANSDSTTQNSFALIAANTVVPTNSIVVFKATGKTWIEVKSVNGITILKKLLSNGEVAGATGTLPLTVIVGRADVTQVEVRGKEVDLMPIAKNNVARFEVN